MWCCLVATTGTDPRNISHLLSLFVVLFRYRCLHLFSNKHMWLSNSMRLLSLITLLTYLQNHELHMLIVWQYHKHKETLQRARKSAIAEPPYTRDNIVQYKPNIAANSSIVNKTRIMEFCINVKDVVKILRFRWFDWWLFFLFFSTSVSYICTFK